MRAHMSSPTLLPDWFSWASPSSLAVVAVTDFRRAPPAGAAFDFRRPPILFRRPAAVAGSDRAALAGSMAGRSTGSATRLGRRPNIALPRLAAIERWSYARLLAE